VKPCSPLVVSSTNHQLNEVSDLVDVEIVLPQRSIDVLKLDLFVTHISKEKGPLIIVVVSIVRPIEECAGQ
jgi:hypothetical protein